MKKLKENYSYTNYLFEVIFKTFNHLFKKQKCLQGMEGWLTKLPPRSVTVKGVTTPLS